MGGFRKADCKKELLSVGNGSNKTGGRGILDSKAESDDLDLLKLEGSFEKVAEELADLACEGFDGRCGVEKLPGGNEEGKLTGCAFVGG